MSDATPERSSVHAAWGDVREATRAEYAAWRRHLESRCIEDEAVWSAAQGVTDAAWARLHEVQRARRADAARRPHRADRREHAQG